MYCFCFWAESKGKEDTPVLVLQEEAAVAKLGKKRKATTITTTSKEETVRGVSIPGSSNSSSKESLPKKPHLVKGSVESGEDTPSPSRKKASAAVPSGSNKQAEQMMRVSVRYLWGVHYLKMEVVVVVALCRVYLSFCVVSGVQHCWSVL